VAAEERENDCSISHVTIAGVWRRVNLLDSEINGTRRSIQECSPYKRCGVWRSNRR
jgi:hypothetical protein